ncbi:hypothetical protein ACH5RR_026879 [Cinchona calisaya]|uniref:Leucine-rich repeat-containing N-terminal plant-type domain-containing protein n=1 Tax=Cinchona calisaya TaxID=153742 RepID=A0ABD2Z713_9GENT
MFDYFGEVNINLGMSSMPRSRIPMIGVSLIVGFFWALLFMGADCQVTDPTEVRALRAMKQYLIDPNGILSGWSKGDPCVSNWRGVLCFDGPVVNDYLHVRELHLLNMNLSGSLSAEVGRLVYLRILDLMGTPLLGKYQRR